MFSYTCINLNGRWKNIVNNIFYRGSCLEIIILLLITASDQMDNGIHM